MALKPDLQIAFYYILQDMRELYLLEALRRAVQGTEIQKLDDQLARLVSETELTRVASYGIRGEVFFPVPCIIRADPYLLGYYRLLYGLSQKQFYNRGPYGRFKVLEESGEIPDRLSDDIRELCGSLVSTGQLLVRGLDDLSLSIAHDLQMLTIGPQLRGSQNAKIGQRSTRQVFDLIQDIVRPHIKEQTKRAIRIENSSGRPVLIQFSADPDIRITEKLRSDMRPLVSVEIKGGRDVSNVHNRLGEAEKSHQKAKNRGFFEFWTIMRAEVDEATARRESPTTTHFFSLDEILDTSSDAHDAFCQLLASILNIRLPSD
ncbi:MAG: XcyI family restriction endonuclease [Candidatus Brocadiia bacterium]